MTRPALLATAAAITLIAGAMVTTFARWNDAKEPPGASSAISVTPPPAAAPRIEELLDSLRAGKTAGDRAGCRAIEQELGWHTHDQSGPVPTTSGLEVVVRQRPDHSAEKWQHDQLVTDPGTSSGMPAMAVRSNGTTYIVVEDLDTNYLDIYRSTTGGRTWNYWFSLNAAENLVGPSVAIGEGVTNRLLIALELGPGTPSDQIVVFWRDLDDDSYSALTVDSNPSLGLTSPQICVDSPEYANWYAYVVYAKGYVSARQDGWQVMFSRTLDYGATWVMPQILANPVSPEDQPDIDFGGANLFAVYTRTISAQRDVYFQKSGDFGGIWTPGVGLAVTGLDESQPKVAATNGGDAVVVAFTKQYTISNSDIESYVSTNAGLNWSLSYLPYTPDPEMLVDLCVSPSLGQIHAAFWRSYDIESTQSEYFSPGNWSAAELVNEGNAADPAARPTIGVGTTDLQEASVAWMDNRDDIPLHVYFDTADWDTSVIDPGGGGDFPTIQAAVDDATPGDVIQLEDGIYNGGGNRDIDFHGLPITVESLSGDPTSCVIDCQGSPGVPHRGFWFHSSEGSASRVAGIMIKNGYGALPKARGPGDGGAILIESGSAPSFENLIIFENRAEAGGGGVHCEDNSAGSFTDCLFIANASDAGGGGVHCRTYSSPSFTGCTFFGNSGPVAGGIYCEDHSFPSVTNSIISFSTSGAAVYCDPTSGALLSGCDVYGNAGGDWVGCIAGQYGIDCNLSADPLYCDAMANDFTLEFHSLCLPHNNPCGVLMGARGQGCVMSGTDEPGLPAVLALQQNVPNPFNPLTTIRFDLPAAGSAELAIFDLEGRKLRTLVNGYQQAGPHVTSWDGRDDRGHPAAAGIYVCRLTAGNRSQTRTMALLK